MSTVLYIIDDGLSQTAELQAGVREDVTVIDVSNFEAQSLASAKSALPASVARVGILWKNRGGSMIPLFWSDPSSLTWTTELTPPQREFFSQAKTKAPSGDLTVDLLTCMLTSETMISEIAGFEISEGINIQYSLNRTGNEPRADWIMESDGVSVKDNQFTADISGFTEVLDAIITIDEVSTIDGFSQDSGSKTVSLSKNIVWDANLSGLTNGLEQFQFSNGETFDGGNFTITLGAQIDSNDTSWPGLFKTQGTGDTSHNTITNLKIDMSHARPGKYSVYSRGGIVAFQSCNAVLSNCHVVCTRGADAYCPTGTCYNGYIVGQNTQKRVHLNRCTISGLDAPAGGGGLLGQGVCTTTLSGSIINCTMTGGKILGDAGGIVGSNCFQLDTAGNIGIISNCVVSATIAGDGAGGILGKGCGKQYSSQSNTLLHVKNCVSLGDICGFYAGGIASHVQGSVKPPKTQVWFENCQSTGDINGACAGGLIGIGDAYGLAADNGSSFVMANCWSTGTVNSVSGGSILGGRMFQDSAFNQTTGQYLHNCRAVSTPIVGPLDRTLASSTGDPDNYTVLAIDNYAMGYAELNASGNTNIVFRQPISDIQTTMDAAATSYVVNNTYTGPNQSRSKYYGTLAVANICGESFAQDVSNDWIESTGTGGDNQPRLRELRVGPVWDSNAQTTYDSLPVIVFIVAPQATITSAHDSGQTFTIALTALQNEQASITSGRLYNKGITRVNIGASASAVNVDLTTVAPGSIQGAVTYLGKTQNVAEMGLDISANLASFAGSAMTLTFTQTADVLTALGISDATQIRIMHQNSSTGSWDPLTTTLDSEAMTLTASLTSLSPVDVGYVSKVGMFIQRATGQSVVSGTGSITVRDTLIAT